jgi:hypothetical protein
VDSGSLSAQPTDLRPLGELETEITELTAQQTAVDHRWLNLVAEFDRRNDWSDGTCRSCAQWLNLKCGLAPGPAREKVRVAHALENLPKISAAMARGELSYSKVRALTRIASSATEEELLSMALRETAQNVERVVRKSRQARQVEALSREERQQTGRMLSYFIDVDGALVLKARLPTETGALFLKALDAAMDGSTTLNVPEETLPTVSSGTSGQDLSDKARRADALGVLATSFLKSVGETWSRTEPSEPILLPPPPQRKQPVPKTAPAPKKDPAPVLKFSYFT